MNVPALRFKEFSEYDVHKNAFKTFLIKDIANIQVGRDLKEESFSNTQTNEHSYPVYSNTVENRGLYGFYNFEEYNGNSLTVVGRGAGLGTAFARSSGFGAIGRLLVISPKNNEFNVHYFAEYVNFKLQIHNESGGIPQLPGSTFGMYSIALPSFAEQTKIANFLTAVDEKIQLLTQKSDLLNQYKKGVMQHIFSQELRFKDDDGREFPEWEEVTLSKLGKSFNGLTGKAGNDFGEGKPYITYKQIFDDSKIDVNKFSYVQIAENENQNRVKYGDVFFTTSSETPEEVGYCSVLLNEVNDVYLNSFCFGYRINSFDKLHPNFARFIFISPDFRRDVVKLAQGSTRYNISKTNFMEITIKLPLIDEQMKIANFLSAIDDKITQTQAELDAVKQYKQGLLQLMFV